MNCEICCEENVKLGLSCLNCKYTTCYDCFLRCHEDNGKFPQCAKCHFPFSRSMLFNSFGPTKLKKVIIPSVIKQALFQNEKQYFNDTQEHGNYERRKHAYTTEREQFKIAGPTEEYCDIANRLYADRDALQQMEYDLYYSSTRRIKKNNQEGKKVKCQNEECNGFTEINKECVICNKITCCKCMRIKTEDHVCDKEDIDTFNEIKRNAKACPNCGCYVSRTEGCNDMFCTNCKTCFNWVTLEISANNTNPHYFEYLRQARSGNNTRLATDVIECGREITMDFIVDNMDAFNYNQKFYELARMVRHRNMEIGSVAEQSQTITFETNVRTRAKYIGGVDDEKRFKTNLITSYNRMCKIPDLLDLWRLYSTVITEFIYRYISYYNNAAVTCRMTKSDFFNAVVDLQREIDDFIEFYNKTEKNIKKIYGC